MPASNELDEFSPQPVTPDSPTNPVLLSEYIIVTDRTSLVIFSSTDWPTVREKAAFVRKAGGEVTIFKATKY